MIIEIDEIDIIIAAVFSHACITFPLTILVMYMNRRIRRMKVYIDEMKEYIDEMEQKQNI